MKRAVTMALACIFAVQVWGPVHAADDAAKRAQQPDGKLQENLSDRLTRELNLTPEQKEQVVAILKDYREKAKAEREKMSASVKALREQADQKIVAILIPKQARKYEDLMPERRKKIEMQMKKPRHLEADEK